MATAAKLVQWSGAEAPPAQLIAHLKSRGVTLQVGSPSGHVPPARLSWLAVAPTASERLSLTRRRVAVLHPDPGAADALAQSLRDRGATVLVLSLDPEALERAEAFDPDVVLVEPADFIGGCWEIVRALWAHPRLRWTPVVLTPAEPLGLGLLSAPDSDRVCRTVKELSAQYDLVHKQASSRDPFEVSLQSLGPARTLRALVSSGSQLRVSFESCAHTIEVDLAEHLVVGAQEIDAEEPEHVLLGPHALAHILAVDQAKLSVRRVTSAAVTNIMSPLDDALYSARKLSQSIPHVSSVPYIARRELSVPTGDGVITVRPPPPTLEPPKGVRTARPDLPHAARIYPLRPIVPPPVAPLSSVAMSSIPGMPALPVQAPILMGGQVASAAALNIDVEWEASVVSRLPEDAERIESGIMQTALQPLSESWQPRPEGGVPTERPDQAPAQGPLHLAAGLLTNGLRFSLEFLSTASAWLSRLTRQTFDTTRATLSKVYLSASPAAQRRLSRVWSIYRSRDQKTLRIAFVALAAVFAVWLLMRSQANGPAPKLSAGVTASKLKIHVQKLPVEQPVAKVEPTPNEGIDEDEEFQAEYAAQRRASALVSEGHAFRRDNKLSQAESRYREALSEYPGYPRALVGLTRIALDQGDSATALRFARALVRARPQQGSSHLLLGDAHRAAGNMVAAKAAWAAAVKRGDRTAKNRLK